VKLIVIKTKKSRCNWENRCSAWCIRLGEVVFFYRKKKTLYLNICHGFFKKMINGLKYIGHVKKKSFFLIKIKNINDRISAQKFVNVKIITEKHNLPVLKNNEYYWNDLINCQVISISGHYLGIVTHLIYTGSNDVLVIKNKKKYRYTNSFFK